MRCAAIDIGTNTVKLLVADARGEEVISVLSKDKTTRLGQGVEASRRLSGAAIARTVEAIGQFVAEAGRLGATQIVAIATSAARDALNRDEFVQAVRAQCGLDVQVICGQREAELIFRGVSSDPAWSKQPILVLDVGGGSAELIQGQGGRIERYRSLPLGAVRLTEQFGDSNFAQVCRHVRAGLADALAGYEPRGRRLIGTGGTITTLARMEHGQADHVRLSRDCVRARVEKLNAMPLAERKKVAGLPPERADIIVAGGAVFVVAMELLGAGELTVSVRNLRYGALVEGKR